MKTITITQVLNYTQARLNKWYEESKEYGVEGSANVTIDGNKAIITYNENGITGKFELMYWQDQSVDYIFNVWSEDANIQSDKIN